jgi:prepilin-type N-terminal cleavage/methylation domain-containing protein
MKKAFNKKNNNFRKGFTLIELLIVVAIIGLLSSIVMAALTDARQKAQNTAKNQLVEQYVTALELYRDTYGYYPDYGSPSGASICFGSYTADSDCQGSSSSIRKSEGLDNAIKEFIPGPPIDEYSANLTSPSMDMKGIGYKCTTSGNIEENSDCDSYSIDWYLSGGNQECIKGTTSYDFLPSPPPYKPELTRCVYSS